MEIVRFKNGTYGVRRGNFIFGYKYLWLDDCCFWSDKRETAFKKYCIGTLEACKNAILFKKDIGNVV